jgi:hypothetical protein
MFTRTPVLTPHYRRYTLAGPRATLVLVADMYPTRADLTAHISLWFHKREGEGEPDRYHCEVLDGPCWADVATGRETERYLPLVVTPDPTAHGPVFAALEDLYIDLAIRKEIPTP